MSTLIADTVNCLNQRNPSNTEDTRVWERLWYRVIDAATAEVTVPLTLLSPDENQSGRAYDQFKIVWSDLSCDTNNTSLLMATSSNGGTTYSTSYRRGFVKAMTDGTVSNFIGSTAVTIIEIFGNSGNDLWAYMNGELHAIRYKRNDSEGGDNFYNHYCTGWNAVSSTMQFQKGFHSDASFKDTLRMYMGSGNIDAGTITLFGNRIIREI